MERSQNWQQKKKLIAVAVIIAAVALIYIIKAYADNGDRAATSDSAVTDHDHSTHSHSHSHEAAASDTPATTNDTGSASTTGTYKDGTYKASGSYQTPHGDTETINVTLTVAGGTVTEASVQQTPQDQESAEYQAAFRSGYKSQVVGKKLSDIDISRVSGSSLTPLGFNKAVDQIKSQAQSS